MDFIIILGLFLALISALMNSRLSARIKGLMVDRSDEFRVSVFGEAKDQITPLLFKVIDQLKDFQSTGIVIRLFDLAEEEQLRQMQLISLPQEEPLNIQILNTVRREELDRQCTSSLIHYYREAGARRSDEVGFPKIERQEALLCAQVACQPPSNRPFTLRFKDLSHANDAGEKGREVRLSQSLETSDALMIVIPMRLLNNQEDRKKLKKHYQKDLERYTRGAKRSGQVWVVVCHLAEEISPHEDTSLQEWVKETLPQLRLIDSIPHHITTLNMDDPSGLSRLKEGGILLLERIADEYRTRNQKILLIEALQNKLKLRRWWVAFILFVCIWLFLGHLSVKSLPILRAVDVWSVDSLQHAQRDLLRAYEKSEIFAHPLTLHQEFIIEELNFLSELYLRLYQSEVDLTVQILSQDKLDLTQSLNHSRDLSRFATALNRFQRAVHRRGLSLLREPSLEQMKLSLKGLSPLLEIHRSLSSPSSTSERVRSTQQLRESTRQAFPFWERNCLSSKLLFCELITARKRLIDRALNSSLDDYRDPNFESLMSWRSLTCTHEISASLTKRYESHLMTAWQVLTNTIDQQAKSRDRQSEEMLNALKSLKKIYIMKDKINEECIGTVWSIEFERLWRERVGAEALQLSQSLSAILLRSSHQDGPVLKELIVSARELLEWSEGQLKTSARTRVIYEAQSASWLTELIEALSKSKPKEMHETINRIKRQLNQLKTLPKVEVISQQLMEWTRRIATLEKWLNPHRIEIHADKVVCEKGALKNVDEGNWSWLRGDLLRLYFTLSQSDDTLSHLHETESSHQLWSPWAEYQVMVFERDGEVDYLTKGQESNDTPIGSPTFITWTVLPDQAQTLKLNISGLCKAVLRFEDPSFPTWLSLPSRAEKRH